MSKKQKIVFLTAVLFFSFGYSVANAQTNSCPSYASELCPDGSCTNDLSLCRTSSSSTGGTTPSTSETCTGNLRYDLEAAKKCAALAEAQGTALGYSIDCDEGARSEPVVVDSNVVGYVTSYDPTCTVNGSTGFGAQSLAGYTGSGACIYLYDPVAGTACVYGSGYNINTGWNTLKTELALISGTSGAGGTTGGTSGISGQTLGGSSTLAVYTRTLLDLLKKLLTSLSNITSSTNYISGIPVSTTTPGSVSNYLYSVVTDKASYCVGESPLYTVFGPTNLVGSKILWSSRFNGVQTQELDSDYGYVLSNINNQAYWSGYGNAWTEANIGSWEKQANVNSILKSVKFEVKACATETALSCSPKTQTGRPFGVSYLTAFDNSPNFNWLATYNWSAPGATKPTGQGVNFGTSYAQAGIYKVTVESGGASDSCEVVVQ